MGGCVYRELLPQGAVSLQGLHGDSPSGSHDQVHKNMIIMFMPSKNQQTSYGRKRTWDYCMLVAGVTVWGFFAVLCTATTTRRVMLLPQPVFVHNNPEFTSKKSILKFTTKRCVGYFPSSSKSVLWSKYYARYSGEFCHRRLGVCWFSGTAKQAACSVFTVQNNYCI